MRDETWTPLLEDCARALCDDAGRAAVECDRATQAMDQLEGASRRWRDLQRQGQPSSQAAASLLMAFGAASEARARLDQAWERVGDALAMLDLQVQVRARWDGPAGDRDHNGITDGGAEAA